MPVLCLVASLDDNARLFLVYKIILRRTRAIRCSVDANYVLTKGSFSAAFVLSLLSLVFFLVCHFFHVWNMIDLIS